MSDKKDVNAETERPGVKLLQIRNLIKKYFAQNKRYYAVLAKPIEMFI